MDTFIFLGHLFAEIGVRIVCSLIYCSLFARLVSCGLETLFIQSLILFFPTYKKENLYEYLSFLMHLNFVPSNFFLFSYILTPLCILLHSLFFSCLNLICMHRCFSMHFRCILYSFSCL